MLAVLWWVFWTLGLLGGGWWTYAGPNPAWGHGMALWLLVGALGLRVFPVAL